VESVTANASASPAVASTWSIRIRAEELASASVKREPIRRTACTEPGMSGRSERYRAAIRSSTSAATCSGVRGTPTSSARCRDHSPVLIPIIRSWLSGRNARPCSATYPRRTSSQTSSESMMTPSRSKTTALIVLTAPLPLG